MNEFTVRVATRNDAPVLLQFITELAEFEKAEHEVKTNVALIESSLFDEESTAHALIGQIGTEPVAMAVYFFNYSTWLGRNGLYLEDLYVSPTHRGVGAGSMMLSYLAKLAIDNDCGRFEWSVLDWNQPAIDVYESIGAVQQSEWVGYRLTGEALKRLAAK